MPLRTFAASGGRGHPFERGLGEKAVRAVLGGLFAEVHGLAEVQGESVYRVELTLRPADRASLPSRVASWLGQRLGLSSPDVPPRLAWTARAGAAGPAVIAVDLLLDGVDDGMHVITLRVRDEVAGGTAESTRLVRIVR